MLLFFLFTQINLFFSSDTNIKSIVLDRVRSAKREILLSFNSFSDKEIAEGLLKGKERKVKVSLLLRDGEITSDTAAYSLASYLAKKNLSVYLDTSLNGSCQRFIIIDDSIALLFPNDLKPKTFQASFYLLEVSSPHIVKGLKRSYERLLKDARREIITRPMIKKEEVVYITPKGKKYHRAGCGFLRGEKRELSKREAEEKGYKPCKVCRP